MFCPVSVSDSQLNLTTRPSLSQPLTCSIPSLWRLHFLTEMLAPQMSHQPTTWHISYPHSMLAYTYPFSIGDQIRWSVKSLEESDLISSPSIASCLIRTSWSLFTLWKVRMPNHFSKCDLAALYPMGVHIKSQDNSCDPKHWNRGKWPLQLNQPLIFWPACRNSHP